MRKKGAEILAEILGNEGIKLNRLAKKIGCPAETLYHIRDEKTIFISEDLAEKIIKIFPLYNKKWLMTGDEPMLNSGNTNPFDINSNDSTVMKETYIKLVDTLNRSVASMNERDQQINRLLDLLENSLGKRKGRFGPGDIARTGTDT